MKIRDAKQDLEQLLGRTVTVVHAKRMTDNVMVMITDDEVEVNPKWSINTRRLTIFHADVQIGQFILGQERS